MELIQIKKELYKQKPVAIFKYILKGIALYSTEIDKETIYFTIPISDMGDSVFAPEMDAKLLIRWITL